MRKSPKKRDESGGKKVTTFLANLTRSGDESSHFLSCRKNKKRQDNEEEQDPDTKFVAWLTECRKRNLQLDAETVCAKAEEFLKIGEWPD